MRRGSERLSRRELRASLAQRDGARCRWCGREVREPAEVGDTSPDCATIDHLRTRWEGGSRRDPGNAVLACHACNADRGGLPLVDWRAVLLRRRLARWWRTVRGLLGLALVALWCLWWLPTVVVLLGRLLLDRGRFWGVVVLGSALRGVGARGAARWVYRHELARCARRRAALDRRGLREADHSSSLPRS